MSRLKEYLLSKGWSNDQISALSTIRDYFFHINWIKTIWFNFKALPIKQAYKLPFLIGFNVKINHVGKILLVTKSSIALVSIGVIRFNGLETNYPQTVFTNVGTISFAGRAKFHPGAKLVVYPKSNLIIGNRVSIGSMTKIVCYRSVKIGNDVQISWDSQVFDTDFHFLHNVIKNKYYPRQKEVVIEDNVFVGNSCTVGKGTYLPNGSVVSCCSKVSGDFKEEGYNLLLAGNPAKIIARGFNMGNAWFPELEVELSRKFAE